MGSETTAEVVGSDQGFNLQQRTRQACSITEDSFTIITGGYDGGTPLKSVVKYGLSGFISNMPSLIAARGYHGCGGFINNINKKVTTAQVSMILYSITTIL